MLDGAHHARLDGCRVNRVHAHATGTGLDRGRAHQAHDRVFAGGVGRHAGRAPHARNRRGDDDAAAALAQHDGQAVFQAQEDATNIDRHDAVEIVDRVVGHRAHLAFDAGVAKQHVELPMALHRRLDHGLHRGVLAHIGHHMAGHVDTQLRHRRPQPGLVQIDQHHLRALRHKHVGGGQAYAARGTCDHRHFALKSMHVVPVAAACASLV